MKELTAKTLTNQVSILFSFSPNFFFLSKKNYKSKQDSQCQQDRKEPLYKKGWSSLIKLMSVLNIEACWPLCVLFFLSLLLFLVVLLIGTIHKIPEHHKNPLFLKPQIIFLLPIKTIKPTYFLLSNRHQIIHQNFKSYHNP